MKREREKERAWFGEHLLHPTLFIKPFVLLLIRCPHGTVLLDMVGWYGRRRGSWCGKSEVRSEVEWFCQKCGTENWWSRTDCRHCASVTNDAADAPQTSVQEKIAVLEKTLLAGKRVLEKELEKLQRNSMARRTLQSTSRPSKIGQQRIQTHRVRECKAGGDAREPQSTKRNFESGLRRDQDYPRGPAARRRID